MMTRLQDKFYNYIYKHIVQVFTNICKRVLLVLKSIDIYIHMKAKITDIHKSIDNT